jgi:hypothetical protein
LLNVTWALACLAGIGWDYLRAFRFRSSKREAEYWGVLSGFLGLYALVLTLAVFRPNFGRWVLTAFFLLETIDPEYAHRVEWDVLARQAALAAVVAVLLIPSLYLARRPRWRARANCIVITVLGLDLYVTSLAVLPSGSPATLEPLPEHHSHLARLKNERFLEHAPLTQYGLYGVREDHAFRAARSTLAGSWATADRVFAITQNSSFMTHDLHGVLSVARNPEVPAASRARLLDMLNCGLVVKFPPVTELLLEGELGAPEYVERAAPLPRPTL